MYFVCKDHVIDGLNVISIPHVRKLKNSSNCKCSFCKGQAHFKLYHLY